MANSVRLLKLFFRSLLLSLITYHLSLIFPPSFALAATPSVTSLNTNTQQVNRYQKFEAGFQISKSFPSDSFLPYYYYDPSDPCVSTSPCGRDGISIDSHFTAPSGRQIIVPAFYYQDYFGSGAYLWKLRFAPEEIGNYTYYISIQDKEGSSRYPATGTLSFNSINSNFHGFIRVSAKDPRFFAFSDGTSFIPIGSGRQWWKCCGKRVSDFIEAFNNFGQNGINFTRVWDQNDGYNLTVEGHFDAYTYPDDFNPGDRGVTSSSIPRGTQFNQRGNQEEDQIIEAAERNGVYLQLCSHFDAYWIWDASIAADSWDSWWNPHPVGWEDTRRLNYWKRNFRYRVARWGYSTSVFAWEHWNELGHVPVGSAVYNFYQTYGQYQKQVDPYNHLRTTSQGSQAYSPGFWSSSAFDIANYHDYMMISRYPAELTNDEVNFVQKFAWCLGNKGQYCSGLGLGDGSSWSGEYKPWVWGEIDVGTSEWNVSNPKTKTGGARIRMLHNTTWAGLFSPMGTSPLDWYWDQEDDSTTQARYNDRKAAAAFFKGIDYGGSNFAYLTSSGYGGETISSSNSQVRVFGMRRQDKKAAYLWLVNKDSTWDKYPNNPTVNTNTSVTGLLSDTYRVEIWNTANGQVISQSSPHGPTINLSLNQNYPDVAVKIESASGLPTSPPLPTNPPQPTTNNPSPTTNNMQPTSLVPSPTSTHNPQPTTIVPPSTNSCPQTKPLGDADCNGYIDDDDYLILKNELSGQSQSLDADFDHDQIVNLIDFEILRRNLYSSVTPNPTATRVPTTPPTGGPNPTATRTPTHPPPPSNTPPSGPTTTPYPTYPPGTISAEWTQDAHDAQRTGYTPEEPSGNWTYAWSWNGPDSSGGAGNNFYDGPLHDARSITGGAYVYVPAGSRGLYALSKSNGSQAWNFTQATINSTPAYDSATGSVYAAGSNGNVYKINGSNGNVAGTYSAGAGSEINKPILLIPNFVFVVTKSGQLHKIRTSDMSRVWIYSAGSGLYASIPAAYSATRDLLVYATSDLYVHAVRNSDGSRLWRVKPTVHTTGDHCGLYNYDYRWPVIADQHGIVFIRLRNPWDGEAYGTTNAAIRSALTQRSDKQSLFALNLSDGSTAFIPAVPPSGGDHRPDCPCSTNTDQCSQSSSGPLFHSISNAPIVKVIEGKEVVYTIWRNSQAPYDARWDAFMGEMVLDSNTVPGLSAGDLRIIDFKSQISTNMISDEIHTISMAGDTLFNHHICSVDIYTIINRGSSLGLDKDAPIATLKKPLIVRQVQNGGTNHYTSGSVLGCYGDGSWSRSYSSPTGVFWIYQGLLGGKDMLGNYNINGLGSEEGSPSRYVYVSDGLIITQGPRGDLFVLSYN